MAAALVAISASGAMAGFTAGPYSGDSAVGLVAGAAGVGAGNGSAVYNHAGPDFIVGDIVVEGDLTSTGIGSWQSEARIEICNPAACVSTPALSSVQTWSGTAHIGPITLTGANAFLTGTSIGNWTFEFFESYNDGGAAVDATWSNLTIQVQDGVPPPPPPPAFSGSFVGTPNTLTLGNKAIGTTIWDDQNPQPGLTDGAGELALGTRVSTATFDNVGNEVAYVINHAGGDLFVDLTGLSTDLDLHLIDATGLPSGGIDSSEGVSDEHVELLGAAAGTYYVVVDTFGAANAGSTFSLTYTPEPATLALLSLGALGLIRRRR
ncbi:MAG: PPC domain-containing protein [Planctomycetes bacterium]|nr:PPC domain-containing protein [Planctomycetota bacterium]